MTAPIYVATRPDLSSFAAGPTLPTITPTPQLIADQTTLTGVLTAAGKAGVELRFSTTGTPATPPQVRYVIRPASIADGQTLVYSAALDALIPVSPPGKAQIAAGTNTGNGFTTVSATAGAQGASVAIALTDIAVPASADGEPVTLHYCSSFLQSAAGDGSVVLAISETTSGADVITASEVRKAPGQSYYVDPNRGLITLGAEYPIGPIATPRTFRLLLTAWAGAGTALQGFALNSTFYPSSLRAVRG